MNSLKKILGAVGFLMIYLYFLGFFVVATPYYNWRYAQEHGFANWLFFGEFVPTAKAAIWPYYAVAAVAFKHDSAIARSSLHYDNSVDASFEALKIIKTAGSISKLNPKEAADVERLLQASVSEAELVDDSYLHKVHSEFLVRFRNDYTGSLRSLAESVASGDRVGQICATASYNQFAHWVEIHEKELKFP